MRLLVIEDNERLADLVKKGLEEQGYAVDTTASGREGEEMAAKGCYDVIILDLMLPDHDGVQLCRSLRRRKVSTPVLMLTALSSTDEKVAGLEAGADDYLTKPFDLEELIGRVRALLRRAQSTEGAKLRFGGIEMDLVGRTVTRDGKRVDLTTKEFALLEYFMRKPERVLTRTNIGERVWGLLFQDESNVIEVYVSRLRNKIDKGFDKPLIHTVIGTGYTLSTERNVCVPE
jgi:DNA-binding response OmpR family regulator